MSSADAELLRPDTQEQAGMRLVPGGTFRMGSDRHYPEEAPVHRVKVDGFWMDSTPVTNRRFREFVEATGYVTFAEIAPDPKDYPGALPHMLKAGSLVFVSPDQPVDLAHFANWWSFKFGANWRRPYGKGSSIAASTTIPLFTSHTGMLKPMPPGPASNCRPRPSGNIAARGGLDRREFAWGNEFTPNGRHMANTWQGEFPHENLVRDGFERTSPVDAFPPNGYGLYDMIGNVWEWTSDWYSTRARGRRTEGVLHSGKSARRIQVASYDPCQPQIRIPRKVAQGRLAFLRAQLLPPLPAGRAPSAADRHVHKPCWLQVHNKNRRSTP